MLEQGAIEKMRDGRKQDAIESALQGERLGSVRNDRFEIAEAASNRQHEFPKNSPSHSALSKVTAP
jgi:hypothetical protein